MYQDIQHALGSNPLAAAPVPYRPIPTKPTSRMAISTMKHWLSNCKRNHSTCSSVKRFIPSRLIDITCNDNPRIILRSEIPITSEYVALSYCWGESQPVTTTQATLEQYKSRLPVNTLPQSIWDAIWVTETLGFSYLWVDCICIVQGDEQDWIEESQQMANVYSCAELVIAAT